MGSKKALDADICVKLVHYIDIQKEAIRLLDEKLQDREEYCTECPHFSPDMSYPESAGDSCSAYAGCDFGWDTHFMCEAEKEVTHNRAIQEVLREYRHFAADVRAETLFFVIGGEMALPRSSENIRSLLNK